MGERNLEVAVGRNKRAAPWLKRACLVLILVLAVLSPLLGSARACPFCDGGPEGVNPVKQTVFGHDFWPNLAVAAVPFAVFLGVAAAIHFGPWCRPPSAGRPVRTQEEDR